MIKRKSTLDLTEKAKRNRQVEIFSVLDLCLQVPTDDRLLIRSRIQGGDQQLSSRLYQCKKDKNYHNLQIYLRKYVQKLKKSSNHFGPVSSYSKECSSRRGKTPLTLKSRGPVTESSYQNSLQNSLQSSPSGKKTAAKAQITMSRFDVARHIESEIDREIWEGINSEECIPYCRGITPREEENSQIFVSAATDSCQTPQLKYSHCLMPTHKKSINQIDAPYNMKAMLRDKIKKKTAEDQSPNPYFYHQSQHKRLTLNREKENIAKAHQGQMRNTEEIAPRQTRNIQEIMKSSFYYKSIVQKQKQRGEKAEPGRERTPTGSSGHSYQRESHREGCEVAESVRNPKYGQFHKRIRQAIEGDE